MKKRLYSIMILSLIALLSCNSVNKDPENCPKVFGPYMGLTPTNKPQLLAPELIASPIIEYNGTFSKDGKSFYYTSKIPEKDYITFTEMKEDGSWTEPRIASFSGTYIEYDPVFSPDGNRLYFSSRRPINGLKKSRIWYVEKMDNGWSDPKVVKLTNTDENEFYSSLTNDGKLYFNIWATGKLYKAIPEGSAYKIEELPAIINSDYRKGDPFISPDEDYIIFRGYGEDSFGRGDLYISFNINGEWTEAENLGETINSSAHDVCPFVTFDGKMFIFSSERIDKNLNTEPMDPVHKIQRKFNSFDNGEFNIYYMSTDFIEQMRQKHLNN